MEHLVSRDEKFIVYLKEYDQEEGRKPSSVSLVNTVRDN